MANTSRPENRRFLCVALAWVCVLWPVVSRGAEAVETIKVTVDFSVTVKKGIGYQNTSSLAVSRTGVIAAFHPTYDWPGWEGKQWHVYRLSTDGGRTWGKEMDSPVIGGGASSTFLRDGGVIKHIDHTRPVEGSEDWLETKIARFPDDMKSFTIETARVYLPNAGLTVQEPSLKKYGPIFDKGKIIQLPDGSLLATMYGKLVGDSNSRVLLSRSTDEGHTWRFWSSVAYEPRDEYPELPGHYTGFAEPSLALLKNGQLLCVMRTQGAHLPSEYRPLFQCWSDDLGKTWTKPVPTKPHLMNIWPTLRVLDNGVVACVHGRPGFHVAFSIDNGHTWKNRISFSHLTEPNLTGQVDMEKIGPNRLMAIGGTGGAGTQVFSISVERVKASPARVALSGTVLNEQGEPIAGATAELGPNRYAALSWKTGTGSIPKLGYRSIQIKNHFPTVKTDERGNFRFEEAELGEAVLTVEAAGYAPQHRHLDLTSAQTPMEFRLKPGRRVRGRVVNEEGHPIGGACVIFDEPQWHIHADAEGFFDWSVEEPVPAEVSLQVYKRYDGRYQAFRQKVAISDIDGKTIVLK